MRLGVIIIFLISPVWAFGQNFEDGFSDGDFTSNPAWSGTDSTFVIESLEGNNVLRLDADVAGVSYLSTPSANVTGEWDFFVRIDGSAPSGSNKAEIFLMSDIADLTGAVNGYAVRIGETGDDEFKIVRFDTGTEAATVLSDTTIFEAGGSYRVKVIRDGSGNWGIEVGKGYFGELKDAGATANDNTYSSASFFGVRVTYTVSRSDDFYFDFKIDPPPVLVSNFSVFSDTEIDLEFTRDIDLASVSNTDFELNGSTNAQSFTTQASNSLRITFPAFEGGENRLEVSGIESSLNDATLADTAFTFFVFDEYEAGDILINEFLKDPPSDSGIPEYVELKNVSSKYLSLKDWQIGDYNSETFVTDEDIAILPNDFTVLTSNPDTMQAIFGASNYIDVSLPSLNNSGDQIRLFNASGDLVDSLEYFSDWGGVDVALERRSDSVSAAFRGNWGDSPSANVGTPGTANLIEPDTLAPELSSFELLNDSTMQFVFSEEIKSGPAADPGNYEFVTLLKSFDPVIGISEHFTVSFFAPDTVILEYEQPLYNNGDTFLIINNQEDIFGNVNSGIELNWELIPSSGSEPGDVVISEFMYDPADEYSEFIEIRLTESKTLNLRGWTLNDNSGTKRVITEENFYIRIHESSGAPGNAFVILVPDSTMYDRVNSNEIIVMGSRFPTLNNSEDALVIRNEEGVLMDSLTYFSEWGGDEVSLERRSLDVSAIYPENWGDSPTEAFGTPGRPNQVDPDTTAPFIESGITLNDRTIVLRFSERITEPNASELSNYNFSTGNEIENISVVTNTISITTEDAFADGHQFELGVYNQEDLFGNVMNGDTISFTYYNFIGVTKGTIVINEILYDPLADSDDNLPDQTEYVELFNTTDRAVSLSGIVLHDAPDESGEVRVIEPVSTENKWIPPNGFVLIYAENEANAFADSRVSEYFSLSNDFEEFALRVDRSSLSLGSSGDAIYLSDSTGTVIDSVYFDENWQNPNVFDTDGIALERINPFGPGNEESNWSSSTAVRGGTPGEQNSIFQEPGAVPESVGISFSNNPFSPDGDGFEDNLFINYNLEAPDYLVRVRIFDRFGREVRELANNYQAGFEGSLIWDGLTDDGKKNRVGIYIILFEAYDSASGKNRNFKETVVLARMF